LFGAQWMRINLNITSNYMDIQPADLSTPRNSRRTHWTRFHTLALIATALCALLVMIDIQRPSYWLDEKISVDIASPPTLQQVVANVISGERRPPAYHLSLWLWTHIISSDERIIRLHSAIWAILLIPAAYQLGRRFTDKKGAALTAFVAALAPVTISYGQTVRYYTMVAALSTLSLVLFLDVIRKPDKCKPWLLYIATTLLLLYTDYPAYGVVIAQNILAFVWWVQNRRRPAYHPRWRWIWAQAIMAIVVALWIPVVLQQSGRDFGAADLSNSIAGALLRIAYPLYAWLVGETLFPWTPLAILGAVAGCMLLIVGFIRLKRSNRFTWIVAFGLPFIVSQILLSTVATDSPFVNAPARSMACVALIFILVSIGLAAVRQRWLQVLVAGVIVAGHIAALVNYYRGVDFINTVYNTPARETAQTIAASAHAGDVTVTESDSMVDLYLPASLHQTHFFSDDVDGIKEYLTMHPQAQVWQVIMGRDRTRNQVSTDLAEWLQTRHTLKSTTGFAEQDAAYRAVKSRLIGREAYRFRLTLDEYQPR